MKTFNLMKLSCLLALTLTVGACSSDDEPQPQTPAESTDSSVPAVPDYLKEGTDSRPDWTKPDSQFEFTMSVQVQLGDELVNYQSSGDLICATIGGEVRAVVGPSSTAGITHYRLSIPSSGEASKVSLKYYCDRLHRIYTITDWATFDSSASPLQPDGSYYQLRFTEGK